MPDQSSPGLMQMLAQLQGGGGMPSGGPPMPSGGPIGGPPEAGEGEGGSNPLIQLLLSLLMGQQGQGMPPGAPPAMAGGGMPMGGGY